MIDFTAFATLVAIVVALTAVVKRTKRINKDFLPVVALVTGFVVTIFWGNFSLIEGVVAGFVASGVWDTGSIVKKSILGK